MIGKLVRRMLTAQTLSALTVSLCLLIDNMMVGRFLGVGALAANSLASPVLLIVACRFAEVEISVGMTLLSTFIGLIAALGAEFLAVGLDYPRTEKVQFEDDDYYYFVKAVPKLKLPEDKARSEAEAAQQLRRAAAQAEKGSE